MLYLFVHIARSFFTGTWSPPQWRVSEECVRDLEFPRWQLKLGFYPSERNFFHLYTHMTGSMLEGCPSPSFPGALGAHLFPYAGRNILVTALSLLLIVVIAPILSLNVKGHHLVSTEIRQPNTLL